MKGQRIVLLVLCCALLHSTASGQRDRTLELEASGTDVVLATIARLNQAKIFSDDNRLLRRVAHVESRDGSDADTFRTDYNGGIWQVDEQNFLKTQDRIAFPFLAQPGGIFELLLSALNIDWTAAQWADLRLPLISAVAARIFFEIAEMDIPAIGDVQGQGEFWKSSGFNTNSEDTVERFVADVNALELEECPNRGIDLAFALDSSGSVGEDNFELERNLVSDIVERFAVGPNATRVSVVSFSGFARVNFKLNNFTTQEEVLEAVKEVEYFDIAVGNTGARRSTNTADALQRLRTEVFTAVGGARSADTAIPRIAVVITDGRSNINQSLTIPSALALRESGVTVYAIGVGEGSNMEELSAIASSEDNVRLLSSFDVTEFAGVRSRITAEACIANVPVNVSQLLTIQLDEGEMTYFQYQVPPEGLTVTVIRQQGRASLFASNKIQNPNPAFYDYRIDDGGEVFVNLDDLLGERERREAEDEEDGANGSVLRGGDVLFISLQGTGSRTNRIQLVTSLGNTITIDDLDGISSGQRSCSSLKMIVFLVLLTICTYCW